MTWTYRPGARGHKVSAEDAATEFERIRQANGEFTASMLVEESKSPTAPCHHEFNWNDKLAAHEHRLMQARTLIRDVVFIEPKTQEPLQFYHVPSGTKDEGRYEFVKRLVHVRSEYQLALGELLSKLEALEESIQRLLRAAKGSKSSTVRNVLSGLSVSVQSAKTAIQSLPQN